jgi:ATP-dependent DNA helicase DinG
LTAQLDAVFGPSGKLAQTIAGFRLREGQVQLAQAVTHAFEDQTVLVAEAGTGIGKTFAYLVPSLLSGRKVVISTATKTLQDQLYQKDLVTVTRALGEQLGAQPNAMVLKGRANYVCHFHLDRNLNEGRFPDPSTGAKLRMIREYANASESGDKGAFSRIPEDDESWQFATSTRDNCLGQECPNLTQCYVMRARRRALAADVVIVNHHLFCADLALRDEGVAELLPTAQAIIFDEAHQLPGICSQFMGQSVSARNVQQCLRDAMAAAATEAPELQAQLREFLEVESILREVRLHWPGGQNGAKLAANRLLDNEQLHAALSALKDMLGELKNVAAAMAVRGPLLERSGLRCSELHFMLAQWLSPSSDDANPKIRWAESFQRGWSLHSTPLDVGPIVQRQLFATPKTVVFVSATLAIAGAFTHFTRTMGISGHTELAVGSPFDYAKQARVFLPPALPEPASPLFLDRLLEAVLPLLRQNRGRAFILCTSLKSVSYVGTWLKARPGVGKERLELLIQGEQPRARLLELFRQSDAPVLVGSASFWEGVDVVGDQLSIVVIDKLPFAPPDDPVLQARMDAAKRRGDDPFRDYQLPAAAIMLKQGAGRLIRSETDKGVLVLGDPRLIGRSYGKSLLRSLPPFGQTQDLNEVLLFLADNYS